jgi:hypothetical protein
LDENRQIGILNFENEKHTYSWLIRPEAYLAKGRGKLEIGAYETRDHPKNGHNKEDRRLIAWTNTKILLI